MRESTGSTAEGVLSLRRTVNHQTANEGSPANLEDDFQENACSLEELKNSEPTCGDESTPPCELRQPPRTDGGPDDLQEDRVYDFGRSLYYQHPMFHSSNHIPNSSGSQALNGMPPRASMLSAKLRGAYQGDGSRKYVPLNYLDGLINLSNVHIELEQCLRKLNLKKFAHHDDLKLLAKEIVNLEQVSSHPSPKWTSRRALFASLVLMDRPSSIYSISSFVHHEWWDCDLPFKAEERAVSERNETSRFYVGMHDKLGKKVHDECFSEWSDSDFEAFSDQQWRTLAPYFMFATEEDWTVRHYDLDHHISGNSILPVITPTREELPPKSTEYGGFGEVRQRKFHPAHHNHRNVSPAGVVYDS